jgi:hypothetical protein
LEISLRIGLQTNGLMHIGSSDYEIAGLISGLGERHYKGWFGSDVADDLLFNLRYTGELGSSCLS